MPSANFKMLARKSWVIVPWTVFAATAAFYFGVSETPALIYPVFLPLLLWIYESHESRLESPSVPWVLGTYALLLMFIFLHPFRRAFSETLSMMVQWIIIGCSAGMAALLFDDIQAHLLAARDKIGKLAEALKAKAKTHDFYRSKIPALKVQIWERKRLAAYAREMGTLLDPVPIRETLIQRTQNLFPQDQVFLRTAPSADPVDLWVRERKNSILIKDGAADKRLAAYPAAAASTPPKSAIATPLLASRKLVGILRVDSSLPGRFSEADVQQLEVYASLATLALENAHLFSEINALATRDGLTGLATQRIFHERLSDELLRAARFRTSVSLVMADIDHFKLVNDRHGHPAGDQVLKDVAQILLGRLRPVDMAARYGGEEFCLILPGFQAAEARRLAEEIRQEIETRPVRAGSAALSVTASFGVASFPEDAQTESQLVRKADERLYQAKSQGRNKVVGP